jgi:hypothetical protein
MTNRRSHANCLHPRTAAARKVCRAQWAELDATLAAITARAEEATRNRARRDALCDDCVSYALDPARENLFDQYRETGMTSQEAWAKVDDNYLLTAVDYVEGHVSTPCPAHRNDSGDWA